MTKLEEYNDIMNRYYNGEFGNNNLTMSEILERAGRTELFDEMAPSEIDTLINQSAGFMKLFFIQKRNAIKA